VTAWEDVGHLALVLTPRVLNVLSVSHAPLLTAGPQLSWDNWTGTCLWYQHLRAAWGTPLSGPGPSPWKLPVPLGVYRDPVTPRGQRALSEGDDGSQLYLWGRAREGPG